MKIWHILSNRWYSAITAYALNCCEALSLLGETNLFSPKANTPAEKKATDIGLPTRPLSDFGLLDAKVFLSIFNEFEPDIVFCYGGPEQFLCLFLLHKKKRPKIIRFNGAPDRKGALSFFRTKLKSAVDFQIYPNHGLKDSAESSDSNRAVVRYGFNTARFQSIEKIAKPNSKRRYILIFGRFDPVKGHEKFFGIYQIFLKLWKKKHSSSLPPSLLVAGKEANLTASYLKESARQFSATSENRIEIACDDFAHPADLMSQACIGVVSSLDSEQICRVAEEFLTCGTPIVVSGVGALDETLFPGAGYSYKGLNNASAAEILLRAVEESDNEPLPSKQARAKRAASLFGSRLLAW